MLHKWPAVLFPFSNFIFVLVNTLLSSSEIRLMPFCPGNNWLFFIKLDILSCWGFFKKKILDNVGGIRIYSLIQFSSFHHLFPLHLLCPLIWAPTNYHSSFFVLPQPKDIHITFDLQLQMLCRCECGCWFVNFMMKRWLVLDVINGHIIQTVYWPSESLIQLSQCQNFTSAHFNHLLPGQAKSLLWFYVPCIGNIDQAANWRFFISVNCHYLHLQDRREGSSSLIIERAG